MSGEMTVRDAGRRGGRATSALHDHAHYQRIGAAGAAARRLTPAERQAIARLGWRAQQAALGPDGRAAMARAGGLSTLAHHGTDYFRRISEASRAPRGGVPAERTSPGSVSGVNALSRGFRGQQTSPGRGS